MSASKMKTVDVKWMSAWNHCLGVVLAEDDYKQCAFLGVAHGMDENKDIKSIKDFGYKMFLNEAIGFFEDKVDIERYKR
jgi:hypothetical protein